MRHRTVFRARGRCVRQHRGAGQPLYEIQLEGALQLCLNLEKFDDLLTNVCKTWNLL